MSRLWPLVLAAVVASVSGMAGEQTPSFSLSLQGSYTWSFALGIGDREALRPVGLTPWVPSLRQGFAASIEGRALEAVTIRAKLDSRRGVAFQEFGIYLDTPRWKGVLGNFSLTEDFPFAVRKRTLLGARIAYRGDGFGAEGFASRSLGRFEVRVFKGERAHAEAEFYLRDPQRPWEPPPYRADLRGLYHFRLVSPYVPDFTRVLLELSPGEGLRALLERYGLGFLREVLEGEPRREFEFAVVRDSGADVLLLLSSPGDMLKRWVEDAIREYNERSAAEERYPFVPGSELEARFLGELSRFARVVADGDVYPLDSASRGRYLWLGAEGVIPETLEVEVRRPEEDEYAPLVPGEGFSFRLFPEEGVLWFDFPPDFFRDGAALRVSFDHSAERAVFVLSPLAGIVPDSERVFRDGKRLARGDHYAVDYEAGILQLFSPLKEGEELRVEYEVPHGLGTGPQEDFLGLTLSLGKGAKLFVFRSAESVELTPATPTMPNDHTVAGVVLSGSGAGWGYSLVLGGSVNVFPPGKNERVPGPNRVTAIVAVSAPDGEYLVASHLRGISVFKDGVFRSYRSGRRVHDLLYLPGEAALLLAEGGALVVVDLSRSFPFDWRESYTELSLGGGGTRLGDEALAVGADGEWTYVATDRGIIRFPVADLGELSRIVGDEDTWRSWRGEHWGIWAELPAGERPTALLAAGGGLYLGTDRGLYLRGNGSWVPVPGVPGPVYRMVPRPSGVYVATAGGIVRVRGEGAETVIPDVAALSLAFVGGTLYYGTETGLYAEGEGPLFGIGAAVTALGTRGETLWAGSEAWGEEGAPPEELYLWEVEPEVGAVTGYPAAVSRIPSTDPGTYRDIPPEGNTDRGLLAQFSWSERLEGGSLSWYVRTSTPGYAPIDRPPPGDTHSVGFKLSRRWGDISLGIQGDLGMRELFTRPVSDIRGVLSFSWSPGMTLGIQLTPRIRGWGRSDARAEAGYALTLSWENPGEGPGGGLLREVSARLVGGIKGAAGSGGTAQLRATLGPFGPLTLGIRARRPYLFGGEPTGKESLDATLSGKFRVFGIPTAFSWQESLGRDLGPFVAGGWRFSRKLSLVPRLPEAAWGGWEFRPSLSFAAIETDAELKLVVKGSPSVGWSPAGASGRLILGFELGYRRAKRTGDMAFSASFTPKLSLDIPSALRAELRGEGELELLVRAPSGEARPRARFGKASLTLVPLLWEGVEPRLTFSYAPGRFEFSMGRTELAPLGVDLEASARLVFYPGSGDAEGEVKFTTAGVPLAEGWSLNLEGGYLLCLRRGTGLRQGLFLRGNLSLGFSF